MATLPLSLTGVASNWVVPQTMIQVSFAQGALLANPGQTKVLLTGVKTTAGSATVGTQVYGPLSRESDVTEYFGAGSPIHRAWLRISQVCKTAAVYAICAAESAGTAASDTITFATAATGAGSVRYTCAGETVEVAFQSGDAYDTDIAADLVTAINAQTHWPIAATRSNGVVTVTAKIKGTSGNWIRHRASITSGVGTTVAVAHSTLTSGATDESYTTLLSTILSEKFDYIVPCINPTAGSNANIAALVTQMQTQALATSNIRQQAIVCSADTLSNATTFVTAYNKPPVSVLHQKNSEWEPLEIAAHVAGIRYNEETGADPGVSYDGYGLGVNDIWAVPAQYSTSDRPSAIDINTALSVGLSPIAVNAAGKSYLVMSCTAAGADPRVRDTAKVTVAYRFASDLAARYASQWARSKLADNEPDGAKAYPSNVLTPERLATLTVYPMLRQYRDASLLVNVDGDAGSIASASVGIDPSVSTRINCKIPLNVTPLNHQAQFLINEVSSG